MTKLKRKPLETHLWCTSSNQFRRHKGEGCKNIFFRIPLQESHLPNYYKHYYLWFPKMNYILNLLWNLE